MAGPLDLARTCSACDHRSKMATTVCRAKRQRSGAGDDTSPCASRIDVVARLRFGLLFNRDGARHYRDLSLAEELV